MRKRALSIVSRLKREIITPGKGVWPEMAPRTRQCLKGESRERVLRQAKKGETELSSQGGRVSRHTDTHSVVCEKLSTFATAEV